MNSDIKKYLNTDPAVLERFSKDMVYRGQPQYAYTAGDWKTVSEVLNYCNADKLPVTFCGSQTSMTGSSVADTGVVISLTSKNRILDISHNPKTGEAFVITEPGVILGDLKRAVANEGYLYPPDPTSFNEAQVGATIATNATGEDTFKFGPTRTYVEELEILDCQGQARTLKRTHPFPRTEAKNSAGYFLDGEDIDHVIGSEGTLALITKLKLKILPKRGENIFLLVLPFTKFANCLDAVVRIANLTNKPRALELIGPGAGRYFRECASCPSELQTKEIFLYIKDDYTTELERDEKISKWFDNLKEMYDALGEMEALERVFIAQTQRQLDAIRECRHHIPLKVNEEYFPYSASGGGKVGTDWWVPLHHLREMMIPTYEEAQRLKIPFLVFAHIGNGHPHWNFLTKTPAEFKLAKDFVLRQCRQAVLYGGGVAGEHGIGKIKRDLMNIQHSPKVIKKMAELKMKWDPNWILGRGNILKAPES